MAIAVYELNKILDDRRFGGLHTYGLDMSDLPRRFPWLDPDDPALMDCFHPDWLHDGEPPPRLSPAWRPVKVAISGKVHPTNDYPCVDMVVPAFSARAAEALGELLEGNGEILPLVTDVGSYFAFNVTTVSFALDEDASTIERFTDSDRILSVDAYVFRQDELDGATIFRVAQEPSRCFVTETFVRRAHAEKLAGFDFKRVWCAAGAKVWRTHELRGNVGPRRPRG